MRPISNVVDVTNYVMLALGSPLHAFDVARLGERTDRRPAREAGRDDAHARRQQRELTPDDLVIADATHPVAIAGIMGGEESEVRPETTDLLLEAANFDPLTVLRTSRRLRLRTESSTRWEKGVDPYAAEQAAVYATQLLVELAGARWTGHVDVHDGLPERPRVTLRPDFAERLSGMPFPVEEQTERLRAIGFEVGDDLEVTVPTWRARDVTRSVDLVEEVVRFRIEEVPATLPSRPAKPAQLTRDQRLRRQVEDVFVGAGFHEAYTWTLVPESEGTITLQEPFTAELAALRGNLEHWLVESARRNRNVGVERVALFELARVFLPGDGELPEERWHVAGITDGGYFRAKGAVETLQRRSTSSPTTPRWTSGASTRAGATSRSTSAALFARVPELVLYEDVITYPDVKQDLAFVVDESVRAGDLVAEAEQAAGPELREFRPFDVYRGEQVGPGKKSIAFAVSFRSPERTLTDEDAARLRGLVVDALAERFGAPASGLRPRSAIRSGAPVRREGMRSRRLLTIVACSLAALGSPATAQAVDLFATVGPDFTISLRDAQGQSVTQLDPGAYRIVVQDRSDFHNFHLQRSGCEPRDRRRGGRDGDLGRHARRGALHVRLRPARDADARRVHGRATRRHLLPRPGSSPRSARATRSR